jgi:osmoprotectant transport system substrate-binding protein
VPGPRLALRRLVAALACGSALLAGCTSDVDDPGPDDPDALGWTDDSVDLDGVELTVGSKEPAEQRVLGWIAVEALRAAGAEVSDEINLGGTGANREALLAGLIDLYWEDTGVGWESILERADPDTDAAGLYEDVRERDREENDVVWLAPAPAQEGYGIATSPEVAEDLDLASLQDLGDAFEATPDEVALCTSEQSTFTTDPDGLQRFEQATGAAVPDEQLLVVPHDDLLTSFPPDGFCSASVVALDDPALADADVVVLDDTGVFVPMQPTVTVRGDVLTGSPGIEDVLDPVSEELTPAVLRSLGAQVAFEGESARDVAREWLVSTGLADEPAGDEGSS